MNDAIRQMLDAYACQTRDDYVNAIREILQQLALLGLWRSKFFEHAAFYGGTALRVLHGLDRYSEDLDFSLLKPDPHFTLGDYGSALQRELASFGFDVQFEARKKQGETAIESAFLKANTLTQLIVVKAGGDVLGGQHARAILKIKLEVDADPPGGFQVETRPLLVPIPFAVNAYTLPNLFAGKMHAILCRKWKSRVKGRDWYDLVWYLGRHPQLRLSHLEQRMRQSGDWSGAAPLTREVLLQRLQSSIQALNVNEARHEVARFVRDKASLELWSIDFFSRIVERIALV
ncbi:MAG: nucleotidyl transferase AbiEii/AbiGii toxin family protein [Kiritimatiellae bacterium]|nr:nucleotidyl transferase AbiEii/AbiGii toxin family protein [Kiritimatiellia bacterium]MCO5060454.1 nucleotidyl transferase AbiEii/AbiGii toxin family protein [Kiritimatiellia bacterium]MCO5068051.1 nucleotidyl transferase AbiEii/AbiGii toxin family protein [Kiritimatiellia bacterium]